MPRPHLLSRRDVVAAAGAAAAATPLAAAPALRALQDATKSDVKPGKLLMLGGTRFLGPVIVQAALDAGWEVTLFNRGRSNPKLFKDLEKRVGDRNTGNYASLAEGEWDLCIDTSCYIPGHVTAAIDAIKGRVGHFLPVSTISVYADGEDGEEADARTVDESSPTAKIEPELLPEFKEIRDVGKYGSRYYGALKALCEKAAEDAMPGQVTVVRPGLIVGPDDGSDRYTYWPVRVAEGGEILAPGDPDGAVQYLDVRDLGVFTFDVGARRVGKVMNAVGFDERVTMRQMLESCLVKEDGAPEASFTWVSDEFLMEQEVPPWMGLPLWIPGGRDHYSNQLARKEGLTFRSLEDTAAATLAWHRENRTGEHRWRAGISREKEREVLAAWASR